MHIFFLYSVIIYLDFLYLFYEVNYLSFIFHEVVFFHIFSLYFIILYLYFLHIFNELNHLSFTFHEVGFFCIYFHYIIFYVIFIFLAYILWSEWFNFHISWSGIFLQIYCIIFTLFAYISWRELLKLDILWSGIFSGPILRAQRLHIFSAANVKVIYRQRGGVERCPKEWSYLSNL